ncbi:MAG: hypothetical protein U0736_27235 [Gemmataceae bacterium]
MVLAELFETGEQHLTLDLVADLLEEALLDQLPRRLAGAESGDGGLGHQLLEVVVHPPLDVLPVDRHLDVLLARADVLDLHGLTELLRLFGRRSFDGGGGLGGLRGGGGSFGRLSFRTNVVSHG